MRCLSVVSQVITQMSILFTLCVWSVIVIAQNCEDVFPDAASNSTVAGSITIGWNSRIISSPDNILDTTNLTDNGNPGTSCDTSDCSPSGSAVSDVNFNTFVNGQPDITLNYRQTGTVSPGDYNNLSLASESVLTMNPGVYTFRGSVNLQYLSEIIVASAGTVVIYVRGGVVLNSQSKINDANGDRYVFLFTRSNVTLQSPSTLKGVVYARGDVTLQNGAHITGAVTSRSGITLNSATFITYSASAIANTNFDGLCTSTPVATATLISKWQFDEYAWTGTAGEVIDSSGNNNHGTAVNAATTAVVAPAINSDPGTCSYAELNGTNEYLTVPNLSSTLNETASLAFWINTTQSGSAQAYFSPAVTGVEENGGTDDIFWGWLDGAGRIGISVGNDATTKSTSSINDGTWHHIALTRDHTAGQFKVYVDGTLENSGSIATGVIGNSYSDIGRRITTGGSADFLQAALDEVHVYTGVLSDAEVTALMAETHPCPDLMCGSNQPTAGLFGEYYNSTTPSGSVVGSRTDDPVNFNWGNGSPGVSGVGSNNFSVNWSGFVRAEETGTYYFQTESDDGVRLWVDGSLVINNWTDHAPTTNTSAGITLTAGQAYPVVLQYYENGGGAVIRLRWQTPSSGGFSAIAGGSSPILSEGIYSCPTVLTPEVMCSSGGIVAPGLEGSYYNSVDLSGGVTAIRADSTVNFDWGTGTPGVTGISDDDFSVEWNGYVRPTETGGYTFQTVSDDGIRLWVGGELLIDNWSDHAATTDTSAPVQLEANEAYSVRMQFYENGGYAEVRLRWQPPSGGGYVVVPAGPSPTLGEGSYYCAPDTPAYYGISHSGSGITCEAEAITITAYDASNNVYVPPAGTLVGLSTNVGGESWSPSNSYTFTGSESQFTTYLRYLSPATLNIDVSDGTATESASLDPDMTFVESLLRFYGDRSNGALPTQVAGQTDSNVVVRAVQTDDSGACVARVANTTFTGRLAFECRNPTTCYVGETLSLDGDNVQANDSGAAISFTTVAMDFDAQGFSSLPFLYSDVGLVRLHGEVDIPASGDDPAITLTGTSSEFIVKPYTVSFNAVETSSGVANPQALNGGTGFVAAGETFTVRLEAENALGNRTPNFGNETTPEAVRIELDSLLYPAGGSAGALSGTSGFAAVSGVDGRFQNTGVAWNEVGGIRVNARLLDDDYLGSGDLVSVANTAIGRFYPNDFEITSSSVSEACGAFSYMSQPEMTVAYTVRANRVGGGAVSNYDAALGYLPQATFTHSAENADSGTHLNARLAIASASWSAGEYVLNNTTAAFNRGSAPEAPLTQLQLGLRINDMDSRPFTPYNTHAQASGDCVAAGNCSAVRLGGELEMRYGRLVLADAFGPETAPLPLTFNAEYWDGVNWVLNNADSCTQIANTAIEFPGGTIDNAANKTVTIGSGTTSASFPHSGLTYVGFNNGDAGASLSSPGAGNMGAFEVDVDLTAYPWLRSDWNQDGDYSDAALPSALFTFGSYRGHDRIIYWREVLGQ